MKSRKQMRLPEYDYSLPGEYFLTFCIIERQHVLGKIIDGMMNLSREGKIAEKWIYDLKQKFPDVIFDHFVIMPNHVHIIVEIRETIDKIQKPVINRTEDNYQEWRNDRSKMLIPTIINYFKTNSTK
jgi:putative transposase